MDSTRPTLDCQDHGILAFSRDSITHLSSVMRAGGETTFKGEDRGAHCSERGPGTSVAQRTAPGGHRRLAAPRTWGATWSGRRKWDRREGHDHRGRGQMEPVDVALQAAHSLL